MNLSDSVKALVLAGALAAKCPPPEPPPGPAPNDGGVVDVVPPAPDTRPAPDTTPPVDAGTLTETAVPLDAGSAADAGGVIDTASPVEVAMPPHGPVTSTFEGGSTYLLYPYGGGRECTEIHAPAFTVSLRVGESACVPPGYTDIFPFKMTDLQVCTAGASCVPCTNSDDGCMPQTCFAPLPLPAPGDACTHRLLPHDDEEVTHFVLFRGIDIENPPAHQDGLPMVFNASLTLPVTLNPPPDRPRFVRAALIPAGYEGLDEHFPEECGGTGLCGLFPFQGVGDSSSSWFSFFDQNPFLFSYWPLF
jgi:hypothetical protein